jgi:hypothetical protein
MYSKNKYHMHVPVCFIPGKRSKMSFECQSNHFPILNSQIPIAGKLVFFFYVSIYIAWMALSSIDAAKCYF